MSEDSIHFPKTRGVCLVGGKNGEKLLWMSSMHNFTHGTHP